MKRIAAAGKSFLQGWNSPQANSDERHGMESGFTYDYWLDSTEVTQGEYCRVTGRRPVDSGSAYGVGNDYPVYLVSWFDAVLYCNARSRLEGLDTVYSYSGVNVFVNGAVYELTGLRYDLGVDGYRLPTESEWEYAARGGSSALPYSRAGDSIYAGYYAWYVKNSVGKTHVVGTRLPNGFGLYDMAGNVFEWTNDWKGLYTGGNITNSLGSLLPGNEYEKVIKGGSFNYSMTYLRPSNRSVTYATALSAACEYVGFRCARGIILPGRYIGISSLTDSLNPITIMTNGSDLQAFLGANGAKLVAVNVSGNSRTLFCVDFGKAFPYVMEYTDDRNVYHPVISPDGRFVAYCNRNEGQTGISKVYIRSIDSIGSPVEQINTGSAYIPRWWIDTSTSDVFLLFTNSAINNEDYTWKSTKTFRQKMGGGRPIGDPEVLITNGSYHDGFSMNGRYAVSGYRKLMRMDLETAVDTQLFLSPQNGKDSVGSDQVCNVSISPDRGDSARCMFLDFGYPRVSTITGGSYGIHEYLFIATMQGVITGNIRCPMDEYSWNGVEWSNQAKIGVGCGCKSSGQEHAVYAIDLEGKTNKMLVTGTEIQQPYLWVGNTFSNGFLNGWLGRYYDPPLLQGVLSYKMHLFWEKHNSLEIIISGSSQVYNGIDCNLFTGYSTLNMAYPGCGVTGTVILVKNYIENLCPKVRAVCMGLTPYWLADSGGNAWDLWTAGMTSNKGYLCDESYRFWVDSIPAQYEEAILNAPYYNDGVTDTFGYFGLGCSGWGPDTPEYGGRIDWDTGNVVYKTNFNLIRSLINELSIKGIHFFLFTCPENPGFKYTDHYSISGPSWPTARAMIAQFRTLEQGNPYYHFYDAYNFGDHDYGFSDFFNSNHLCIDGTRKLSMRLYALIDSVLNR